ncbi:MAG: Pre-mRNA-splicing factor cef1 [Watsoniomyces obsoletus]|nr:MAG: Pre-mRNA-splicing factor cef1 [Watsoniomyces obsoletus]
MATQSSPESLVGQFQLERILNQDQGGRRITLYGSIDSKPSILTLERTIFPSSISDLSNLTHNLSRLKNLGHNDIYNWYLGASPSSSSITSVPKPEHDKSNSTTTTSISKSEPESESEIDNKWFTFADLKINIIHPCTEQHLKKYSQQGYRLVTETPEIYREYIQPYMKSRRDGGRLDWVWNILEGRAEQEDVLLRVRGEEEGFLLTPDLNWDRKTLSSLHLLVLVERRDLWSLRDLQKRHIPWLEQMRKKILEETVKLYPGLEEDQLRLYMHYQPTYYHFHIHVVNVALEAGPGQAIGKAFGLEAVISQLRSMGGGWASTGNSSSQGEDEVDEDNRGMADVDITYVVGEASDLWTKVWLPLKNKA